MRPNVQREIAHVYLEVSEVGEEAWSIVGNEVVCRWRMIRVMAAGLRSVPWQIPSYPGSGG